RGRVTDYWDEVFAGLEQHAVLDEQSAFLASLGEARTSRMRDVLATIQSDQDAIIRAPLARDARRRRRSWHGQDRRRAAPRGLPRLSRAAPRGPGRGAVRRAAPALPRLRRRRAPPAR